MHQSCILGRLDTNIYASLDVGHSGINSDQQKIKDTEELKR